MLSHFLPTDVAGQDTMTVMPAGSTTWTQLVAAEAAAGARGAEVPVVAPRMRPFPPEELIGSLPDASPMPGAARLAAPPFGLVPRAASIGGGFQALPDPGFVIPPDTMGAVGPAHVMTMLNSQVRIQNKMGGIVSTVLLDSFWTLGTGLVGDPFDPHLHYDAIHARWIATVDANARTTASQVWFAISDSSDPTGGWDFYAFDADPSDQSWADFPGFGYNATWIAITNNMFPVSNPFSFFDGAKMWVIDAATAVAGGPITVTVFPKFFDAAAGMFSLTLQPVATFGAEPKLYLVDIPVLSGVPGRLRLSEITGTGPAPTWSPSAGSLMPGSGFFDSPNGFGNLIGAEQLGMPSTCAGGSFNGQPCLTTDNCDFASGGICRRIDAGDVQIPATPVVRNGSIWVTHAGGLPVIATDRNAIFWYELDPALMLSSGDPIVQSGVIQGAPGTYLFYPSIAVNAVDDVVIGFSRSDAGRYAEAVVATRAGTSPPGTFGPVQLLKAGEGSYFKTFGGDRNRWGDYSATAVDPADDLTFWTIQEYALTGNQWATWWSKITVVVVCGDGAREGTEECDDGNTVNGDCCSATCTAESAGSPCGADGNLCTDDVCDGAGACGVDNSVLCDDGDACTTGDVCSGGSCGGGAVNCDDGDLCTQDSCSVMTGCVHLAQPRTGCHSPGRSVLVLKQNASNDAGDKLVWKWLKGTTPAGEFGTPGMTTNHALCIYTGVGQILLAPPLDLPAGATWSPTATGYEYDDPANADGMQKGKFKSSLVGRGKIILKGKGANLPDPMLPPSTPVTVQLVNDAPGACWEASFTSGDVVKGTNVIFKAKR
jgi:cysteine-rich repeat protein